MASKTRRFFLNALALTATSLIMRGVAMIFNIYVSNAAGSEAMGLYSLLGSVYSFSITLASAGTNLGTTRIVSDALGVGDEALAKRSVKRALLCCLVSSSLTCAMLFFFAPFIGNSLLGDGRTVTSLRILSSSLIPIAVCSCLSGYFTAVRRVKVNAAFQVLSQFMRISVTVALFSPFAVMGAEGACIALVIGSAASEIFSLIITYFLFRADLKKLSYCKREHTAGTNDTGIVRKLLGITMPVTFSACIRSAFTTLQHILIPKGLKASGESWRDALSSYGVVHGMALPLLLFPSALLYAFAGLLIPEVSECCVRKDYDRLRRVSFRAMTLALIFSIGVSGIMILFSGELGNLIYKNPEVAQYIRIIAPLIPVMYVDSVVDAILKGSGHQVYSMNVNIADALTSCILVFLLVPRLGIWGYVISIYATEILNTTLSVGKMISVSKIKPRIGHQIVMPIFSIVGSTNLSKILLSLLSVPANGALWLSLSICLAILIYVILLFLTRTLGNDEQEFLCAALLSERSYNKRFRAK